MLNLFPRKPLKTSYLVSRRSAFIPNIEASISSQIDKDTFVLAYGERPFAEWQAALVASVEEKPVNGILFPRFPAEQTQQRIHGNSGATAMNEAVALYARLRQISPLGPQSRVLDFGSGWGRMARPFMRDCQLDNIFGYEPNFKFCSLARELNPHLNFLSGGYKPNGLLPRSYFDLVFSWSVFSHLSPASCAAWLAELADTLKTDGRIAFTTWGIRFLKRLRNEQSLLDAGEDVHWYSALCIKSAGNLESCTARFEKGEFVWWDSLNNADYGEAFISRRALLGVLDQHRIPLRIVDWDEQSLEQDLFVLARI